MKHGLFLLLVITLCACQIKQKTNKEEQPDWEILSIRISNDVKKEGIGIFHDSDTCRYNLIFKDSINPIDSTCYSFEGFIILNKKQRDSLYYKINDIISTSPFPKTTVSDYAGDYVSFQINPGSVVTSSCMYSSISDWSEISASTKEIYRLTFDKMYQNQFIPQKYESK